MSKKKVLVLGSNFAGLTAALAVRHELHGDVDVHVVSASDKFLFTPSLIWLPFGKRYPKDITFDLAPTFETHEIEFTHAAATAIDLDARKVTTSHGVAEYDYLVIATGFRNDYAAVPGLPAAGPDGATEGAPNAYTITTLADAVRAGEGWRRFLDAPGDIVVGASQGAGCFGAAYEYLFNTSHQLRKLGLKRAAKITWLTSEPFLGHFGIGGLPHGEQLLSGFLRREQITPVTSASVDHIEDGRLYLTDGTSRDFRYAMIVPPFIGQQVIADTAEIADAKGYVKVRDTYQAESRDEVYAVGIAVSVPSPWQTAVPVGVPKTGFPAERMAHVAAKNIAAQVKGEAPGKHEAFADIPAVCVMDAGNNGVIMLGDRMLPPRKHGLLIPGPQAHAMKLAFEKYFLWKARHGYVTLP